MEKSSLALWSSQEGRGHLFSVCPEISSPSEPWILYHRSIPISSTKYNTTAEIFFMLKTLWALNWFSLRSTSGLWDTCFLTGQHAELAVSKMRNAWKLNLVRHRTTKLLWSGSSLPQFVPLAVFWGPSAFNLMEKANGWCRQKGRMWTNLAVMQRPMAQGASTTATPWCLGGWNLKHRNTQILLLTPLFVLTLGISHWIRIWGKSSFEIVSCLSSTSLPNHLKQGSICPLPA